MPSSVMIPLHYGRHRGIPAEDPKEDALAGSVRPCPVVLVRLPHHECENGVAFGVPDHLPRQERSAGMIGKQG
jgi:hypothetical protein